MKSDLPTAWSRVANTRRAPNPTNVWWDDSKPSKILYGPKGEVLVNKPSRRIGYFKNGH